ncbi:DNA alkylation repair protein [Phaeovulum sp. NW3]|uniref:DNA alkylation repair protein n=1 Tax=Phaeovulum sp. NW3 TaxID=2934933 RepID=UPI00202272CF|nr:DNA alkylation repair protein [Phaeovulum sp. NW3]MCL7465356.1 DNA alkylation repair protein [Phaeovulum sp. NW3]
MTGPEALSALIALAGPAPSATRSPGARRRLNVPAPQLDALVGQWRTALDVPGRVALAQALWATDVHEAAIAAAKLLTQARMRPDDAAWALIADWVPGLDDPVLADHAARAGARRLVADPARLDQVAAWLDHPNPLTRRAALDMTLPWARLNHPKPADLAIRDRVLGWCTQLAQDGDAQPRQAVNGWLRTLAKHDAAKARAWTAAQGTGTP